MSKANIKILLVDDEQELISVYSEMLQEYANFVLTASNGKEALEIINNEHDVDILITDINMPIMDGIELLYKVNTAYPNILTMILTGYRDYASMSKAIQYNVYDFLDKPLEFEIFAHKIKKAITKVTHDKYQKKILKYLLETLTNQSITDFEKLNNTKQAKILEAVQKLVITKITKNEAIRER